MLNLRPESTQGPDHRAPRLCRAAVLLWVGIAAMQAYRAAGACQSGSPSTRMYWALLGTSLLAALVLARRGTASEDGGEARWRAITAPSVVLWIGVTIAMRLIALCAGRAMEP